MASLTKADLREIIEDTMGEKISSLQAEISNMKKTMTAQYLNSISKVLEREAKIRIEICGKRD